jgi:hypothetical protein
MPRTELLEPNPTRAELDQRSRDARLRLEHVERLLVMRPSARQSLLRRVLRRFGLRIYIGKLEGRSARATLTGARRRDGSDMQGETSGGGGVSFAPPAALWPSCRRRLRLGSARPGSATPSHDPTLQRGFQRWGYWCGRGDLNSHVLTDNRF